MNDAIGARNPSFPSNLLPIASTSLSDFKYWSACLLFVSPITPVLIWSRLHVLRRGTPWYRLPLGHQGWMRGRLAQKLLPPFHGQSPTRLRLETLLHRQSPVAMRWQLSYHHLLERFQAPLAALQLLDGRDMRRYSWHRLVSFPRPISLSFLLASRWQFTASRRTPYSFPDCRMFSGSESRDVSSVCERVDCTVWFVDIICMSKEK